MTAPVGADVESLCAKCGDVWHVVVAKVGDRIAKVQCKQCGAVHRLRPPAGATPDKKAPRATRAAHPRAAPPPPPVPASDAPIRPYAASASFAPGDRVRHPVFGVGVVTGSPGPGKIDVAFPGGPRVLAQAKAPPALAPRPPGAAGGDGDPA